MDRVGELVGGNAGELFELEVVVVLLVELVVERRLDVVEAGFVVNRMAVVESDVVDTAAMVVELIELDDSDITVVATPVAVEMAVLDVLRVDVKDLKGTFNCSIVKRPHWHRRSVLTLIM